MILEFSSHDVTPERAAVLHQLGIPVDAEVPPRIDHLCTAAATLFAEHVAPAGVLAEVTAAEFAGIYEGEGKNAPAGPVAGIFPQAEHLAVFAVTVGAGIAHALEACFADRDFALAYTLDATASAAADEAAASAERRYEGMLREHGWTTADGVALRYSPGYCGWDVTGQRRLFAVLRPERIGLTLTDSCLMQPLKSVSGVLLAGPRAMHRFRPDYDFCDRCEDRTCRKRLRELYGRPAAAS